MHTPFSLVRTNSLQRKTQKHQPKWYAHKSQPFTCVVRLISHNSMYTNQWSLNFHRCDWLSLSLSSVAGAKMIDRLDHTNSDGCRPNDILMIICRETIAIFPISKIIHWHFYSVGKTNLNFEKTQNFCKFRTMNPIEKRTENSQIWNRLDKPSLSAKSFSH